MTRDEQIEATLARADAALTTRTIADLAMAQASLMGSLDWAARQDPADEQLIRNVLRTVTDELEAQRNG